MPSTAVRQDVIARARRIVVKVGTNAICDERGRLNPRMVRQLAGQVAAVMKSGVSVTLVASGAVGAGMAELDLPKRPGELAMLQATAAVGQGLLIQRFREAFARRGVRVAQVLLTRDDFEHRARYLNIRNTLAALADCRVVPVINENDAVAVDELVGGQGELARSRFGDNDIIAALVTNMLAADVAVFLTTVDGVMRDGCVLDVIEAVDERAMSLAGSARSRLGSGGMAGKLAAAAMVTRAGEVAVIANASAPKVLTRLLAAEKIGTVFVPAKRRMSSRRRWIGQASRPAGKLFIDDGAVAALVRRGKSLLPSGIVAVDGRFKKGDTVSVIDQAGCEIARGLANYSAGQVDRIKGLRTSQIARVLLEKPYNEVIHRNNMTLA